MMMAALAIVHTGSCFASLSRSVLPTLSSADALSPRSVRLSAAHAALKHAVALKPENGPALSECVLPESNL